MSLIAYTASKAAERFWQSGKCVEVVVDPTGGDVDDDSTTTVTAKVRHRFEGNELDKPVEATVSGVKSIEPSGQKVPSPASFTYTAGPNEGDSGDVTFKSVSNRGIGQTTVTFKVGAKALKVAISGKMTTSGFGVSYTTEPGCGGPRPDAASPTARTLGSAPATAQVHLAIAGCTKPYTQKGTFKLGATRAGCAAGIGHGPCSSDPSTTFDVTGGACLGVPIESFRLRPRVRSRGSCSCWGRSSCLRPAAHCMWRTPPRSVSRRASSTPP